MFISLSVRWGAKGRLSVSLLFVKGKVGQGKATIRTLSVANHSHDGRLCSVHISIGGGKGSGT